MITVESFLLSSEYSRCLQVLWQHDPSLLPLSAIECPNDRYPVPLLEG